VHFENVMRHVLLELGARSVFEQETARLRLPVGEKDEQIVPDPAAPKVVRIVVAEAALSTLQESQVLQLPVSFQQRQHCLAGIKFLPVVGQIVEVNLV
jgi:hypothetical protein